jgi:RHS repeat-associated protein
VATRPLALVQDASLYCYGWDFNKNVTEVFDAQGTIATAYDYSPYGTVTKAGDLIQPVQWSSEMNDEDLELVYYYRYYNPADGRWINRDPIAEQGDWNLYGFVRNNLNIDNLGLLSNDGSGTVIPNTETEGNCIGIACETTKPLSPDPEKIPKNVDLNTFLDIIREILIGDCTRMEKNSTQNETQCQECEREIICLAYFITKQSELILKFIV